MDNMWFSLDLRLNGTSNASQLRHFDEFVKTIRLPFCNWIDGLSEANQDNIDWWVSKVSSRDGYGDDLYLMVSQALWLQHILDQGFPVQVVLTDSPGLHQVLQAVVSSRENPPNLLYSGHSPNRLRTLAANGRHWIGSALRLSGSRLSAWLTAPFKREMSSKDLVIMDTFIIESNFMSGEYVESYYPGVGEVLSGDERERLRYLPTFHEKRLPIKWFMHLRRHKGCQFIFREDYLSVKDYFYAFTYPWRCPRFNLQASVFMGIDFKPLLAEKVMSNRANYSSMLGLLNFRLPRRLAENGYTVERFINWFENQVIDKGLNAGFYQYSPRTIRIGYQGFIPDYNYLHIYPSSQEYASHVVPDCVTTIGPGWVKYYQEMCPGVNCQVFPGFRYQKIHRNIMSESKPADCGSILVLLPLDAGQAAYLLEQAMYCRRHLEPARVFYYKLHPADRGTWLNPMRPELERLGFIQIYELDEEILADTRLVLGSASGISLEMLARGIPLIYVRMPSGLLQTHIPADLNGGIWAISYSSAEILALISDLSGRTERDQAFRDIAAGIRADYFSSFDEISPHLIFSLNKEDRASAGKLI